MTLVVHSAQKKNQGLGCMTWTNRIPAHILSKKGLIWMQNGAGLIFSEVQDFPFSNF